MLSSVLSTMGTYPQSQVSLINYIMPVCIKKDMRGFIILSTVKMILKMIPAAGYGKVGNSLSGMWVKKLQCEL